MIANLKDYCPVLGLATVSAGTGAAAEVATGMPIGVQVTIILFCLSFMGLALRFIVEHGRWMKGVDCSLEQLKEKIDWAIDNTATITDNQVSAESQRNSNPNTRSQRMIKKVGHPNA
jgi:hypothetical protein